MTTMLEVAKPRLQARLAELLARLGGIEAELDTPPSADWEDRASERADDEVLEGLGLAGQQEVGRVRAALVRIAAGEYGLCTECGMLIAPARLELMPETPFCAACAGHHP